MATMATLQTPAFRVPYWANNTCSLGDKAVAITPISRSPASTRWRPHFASSIGVHHINDIKWDQKTPLSFHPVTSLSYPFDGFACSLTLSHKNFLTMTFVFCCCYYCICYCFGCHKQRNYNFTIIQGTFALLKELLK